MDYLIEIYDDAGRCFERWRSPDPMTALVELSAKTQRWNGLGFRNSSCYFKEAEVWNLEIKS